MTEDARQTTIALLDREWNEMDTWLRSLSESDLDRPVFGEGPGWRVRDMIPHFAWWQELAARVAEKIATEGGAPDQRGSRPFVGITTSVEEQNAETYEAWRDRPLADRWKRWGEAHSRMIAAFRKLRPEQLLKSDGPEGMQPYFAMPGLVHLRLHRVDIEAALKETATT
jgi:hypothetical protein